MLWQILAIFTNFFFKGYFVNPNRIYERIFLKKKSQSTTYLTNLKKTNAPPEVVVHVKNYVMKSGEHY